MSNGQVNESMLTLRSSERNSALREAETLKTRLRALEATLAEERRTFQQKELRLKAKVESLTVTSGARAAPAPAV